LASSVLVLAILALPLLLNACGKKGDPIPPLRAVPKPVEDLELRQQGSDFLLEFSYPTVTLGGTAIPGLQQVEVLQLVQPPPPEDLSATVDPRQVTAGGTTAAVLTPDDLSSATSGNRVFLRLPVPPTQESETPSLYAFGVRTTANNGEVSGISNIVSVVPQTPPEPRLIPSPQGLRIDWSFDGDEIEGFNVYRRDVRSRAYRRPLRQVDGEERSYLDPSARFGQRYIYTVTTVSNRDPLIESRLSGEAEAFYQDRFAPEPPSALVVLAEVNQVRLRWDASTSRDVVGYHLYRKRPEGDFLRITQTPVSDREYLDTSVSTGQTLTYRLTAVDDQGNEGQPGEEVTVTVR
jgi:hypothetical protein